MSPAAFHTRYTLLMSSRSLVYSALSGALLGVGFVVPVLWFVSFLGLALFLWTVRKVQPNSTSAFFYGWLLGLVLHCFALYAIFWHTLPLNWYGIESQWVQIVAVGGSWLLASAVLALGTGVFGVALRWVRKDSSITLLTIPALWVLCEWLSSFIFSIISAGPGSLIGAHFTLGFVGYLLANDIVLLQAAVSGGVYVLSFIVVFVNVLVFRVLTTSTRSEQILLVCVVALCLIAYGFGLSIFARADSESTTSTVHVVAVSMNNPAKLHFAPGEDRERAEQLLELVQNKAPNADVLLLPEAATLMRELSPHERNLLTTRFRVIVDSESVQAVKGDTRSRAVYWYADGTQVFSDKQLTLPLGEHVPYLYYAFLTFAAPEFRSQVLDTRSYTSRGVTRLAEAAGSGFIVRFCNETMSPLLYANDVRAGSSFLPNISSHSWFHGSRLVYRQMQNVAKVRAVESRRWYVQSGNMVPAFALDPYGRVVGETTWGISQVLSVRVAARDDITPYVRLMSIFARFGGVDDS